MSEHDTLGWDRASTTAVSIGLACALLVAGGIALGISSSDSPSQPARTTSKPADDGCTAERSAETTSAGTSESKTGVCSESSAKTERIAWEGRTGTGACVATASGQCEGVHAPSRDARLDTGLTGTIHWADLQLDWTSKTPATETLTMRLVSVDSGCEGATCSHSYSLYAKATGTPPLTLNATDINLTDGESLTILVETVDTGPSTVDVDVDERFELTGEIRATGQVEAHTAQDVPVTGDVLTSPRPVTQ